MIKKVTHLIKFSQVCIIIKTNYSAILDILEQFFIILTTLTIKINLRLVKASQFLQQFKLDVWYKPGKEQIIFDTLSRLASTNVGCTYYFYSELDALFTYNATLVKIYFNLVSKILTSYDNASIGHASIVKFKPMKILLTTKTYCRL